MVHQERNAGIGSTKMIDPDDARVCEERLRKNINESGYGAFVSDDMIKQIVQVVLQAQDDRKQGIEI